MGDVGGNCGLGLFYLCWFGGRWMCYCLGDCLSGLCVKK